MMTTLQLFVHQLLFFSLPFLSPGLSSETDTISSNSVIKDPESIVSQNQVFKLGFFTPQNTTNRYLGIFHVFSEKNPVWVANRNRALRDSSNTVTISKHGNLILLNSKNQTVWSTHLANTSPLNTTVRILDSGNLVLCDQATGTTLWQSFSHPSDCFLPTMRLYDNTKTGKKVSISSWKNGSDPQVGNYTVSIEALDIVQFFIRHNGLPLYRSGQWNGHIFIGIELCYRYMELYSVVDDHSGSVYFTIAEGKSTMKFCVNTWGSLVQSFWDDQKKIWYNVWSAPGSDCDLYARCGPFGSCNVKHSPNICSCMSGFEPKDKDEWGRGNWSGGCQRKIQLQCNRDGFVRLPFMKVPDFAEPFPGRGEDDCRSRCSRNCSCIAYAHEPNMGCMLWSDTLIDAQEFHTVGVDLYIRLSASELDNHKDKKLYIIIITTVVGFASVSIFAFVVGCWIAKRREDKIKDEEILKAGQSLSTDSTAILVIDESENVNFEALALVSFETLVNATDKFHDNNLLGRGGFGSVYKGNLADGKEIAIKRLSAASRQGMQEFKNEVIVISKLQHRNLVRLLGFCVQNEEKLLIYEYMPNKSLDICLFGPAHPSQKVLDWRKRFSIIEGIGRGLLYLHRDSRRRIIHRDLKPSNVLLDNDWNPKISDFGMARMFGVNQDHANTVKVVGTYGYMAPEYAMEGRFSEKSDVYSFGVMMLEIVKGKKISHYYNYEWSLSLLGSAWKQWSEDNALAFVDEAITSSSLEVEIVRCIQIALLCVEEFPEDRPTVETILSMLNYEIVELPVPKQPVFAEKWNDLTTDLTRPTNQAGNSVNELTLTELDGR